MTHDDPTLADLLAPTPARRSSRDCPACTGEARVTAVTDRPVRVTFACRHCATTWHEQPEPVTPKPRPGRRPVRRQPKEHR